MHLVTTDKKLCKHSSVGKFETSGPQNNKLNGKCCQVLATKTLSRGFVLSQSTFHLVRYAIVSGRIGVDTVADERVQRPCQLDVVVVNPTSHDDAS